MKPHECVPSLWKTDAQFQAWIRGQIRRIWNRHPVKNEYKKLKTLQHPLGKNGKIVNCWECEICNIITRKVQVDHIKSGFGISHDWDGFAEWTKRILNVTFDDVRILCEECHGIVTHSQRLNISFEEAKIEKEILKISGMKAKDQIEWLTNNGITPLSNKEKRLVQIRQFFT